MSESLRFQDGHFDSYSLTIDADSIKIDCYLLGSITGGTGTECSHTIEGENISRFLESMKLNNAEELRSTSKSFQSEAWRNLHNKVIDHQTDSFVWSETDWSDD